MSNVLMFILYFFFACAGMVLVKMGGKLANGTMFTLPILNLNISPLSLLGFTFYVFSFFLFATLLTRYELSFINPVMIGVVSILIFILAAIFFGETITLAKILGLAFILLGVWIINYFK